MKVIVRSLTKKAIDKQMRNTLEIEIDGDSIFCVYDGEPEDATLSRDFNDCWDIPKLMKKAYEAGKRGEEFDLEEVQVDYI